MTSRSEQIKVLQAACGGLAHSNVTFLSHLLGTEALLKSWDCPPYLCRAGLFHSIYGTDPHKDPPLSVFDSRGEVRLLIGKRAEALVYAFCATPRESLYANARTRSATVVLPDRFRGSASTVTARTFTELLTIEVANWLEQRPRHAPEHRDRWREEVLAAVPRLPPKAAAAVEAIFADAPVQGALASR